MEMPSFLKLDGQSFLFKNDGIFRFYVPEVDNQYSVKTIFLTYHENAYKYFEHEQKNGITFLSAIDIVENPMSIFA